MRNLVGSFVLLGLLSCSFNTTKPFIVDDKTPMIWTAVTAAVVGTILTTGSYFYFKKADKEKRNGKHETEREHDEQNIKSDSSGKAILKSLAVSSLPTASLSLLVWLILGKYTANGFAKCINKCNKDVKFKLLGKFSNGSRSLLGEGSLSEDQINDFIYANFGMDSRCPLLEAEDFLRDAKINLSAAIKYLEELNEANLINDNVHVDKETTKRLSNEISRVLNLIRDHKDYACQSREYHTYKYEEKENSDRLADRRDRFVNNLIMWGSISRGISNLSKVISRK